MAQIILDSNNNLIQGDFDNATLNNRTKLQTTTTNATTNVYVVPNGSSTSAGVSVANNSSLTNASKIVMATNGSTDTQIISGVNGSGSYLPLSFYTNDTLGLQLDTSSNLIKPWSATAIKWYFDPTYSAGMSFTPVTRTLNIFTQAGDGNDEITFSTGTTPTERMRIESGGNVLVGTTTNASSAAKIMVSSTAPQMAVDGNGAGVNSLINWTTSGATKAQTYFDAATVRFYIACNNGGGVYLTSQATSWTSVSDERVKDIIEPIENATEKLGSWRAVIGKYKTDKDGTRRSFLIAQDVIQTFPEAVDANNEEELGVSYTDTIPLLVAAIQEQQTIINELKSRIEALESK